MSDKFKNSKFYRAMKNPKVSRAIYITVVLLLISAAVIVGIVSAANRAKKNVEKPPLAQPQSTDTVRPSVTDRPLDGNSDLTTVPSSSTDAPNNPVSKPLPTFGLPVAGKAAKLHDATLQVLSQTMNDYRVHLGIDIMTAAGAPVYAAADGTISRVWEDPMMGSCIAIEHGGDAVTIYKNLSREQASGITEGASVKAGQQLGTVGDTAVIEIADEPHLHFEMTVGGIQVDPMDYFSAADIKTLSSDTSFES